MATHGVRRAGPPERGAGARLAAAVVGLGIVLAGIAGCSSGPAPAAAPQTEVPSPVEPSVCAPAANFRAAGNALTHIDPTQGVDGVTAALQKFAAAGSALADSSAAQFAPQTAALRKTLAALQTTLSTLPSQPNVPAALGAVGTSVNDVQQAGDQLLNAVSAACPSLPPGS